MRVIEATIGILMVIGLSWGIGYGVFQTHDGKNLRALTRLYIAANENAAAAWEEANRAREESIYYRNAAQEAMERLSKYERVRPMTR